VLWIFSVGALAGVAGRLDEREALEVLYDLLLPFRHLTVHGGVAYHGCAEHHLGVAAAALGRDAVAVDHLERAIADHERIGARLYLGQSHAQLSRVLRRRGHATDAERAAESAAIARTLAEETGGTTITRLLDEAARDF